MADADVRWLQRLENYERALATLERALTLAASRPLSELEQQGLIQAFEFTQSSAGFYSKTSLIDQGVSGISGPGMRCGKPWSESFCQPARKAPGCHEGRPSSAPAVAEAIANSTGNTQERACSKSCPPIEASG